MLLDFADFCRLEKCAVAALHPAHDHAHRHGDVRRGAFAFTSRGVLLDITLGTVSARVLRPFAAIYDAVRADYGRVQSRTIYRALSTLVDERKVAVVVPRGSAPKLRAGGFVRGGYVRWDSPLLTQCDGLASLMDQADDLFLKEGL